MSKNERPWWQGQGGPAALVGADLGGIAGIANFVSIKNSVVSLILFFFLALVSILLALFWMWQRKGD